MHDVPAATRILREIHDDSAITARQVAQRTEITVRHARRVLRRLWKADQIEIVKLTRRGRHWRSRQLEFDI